MLNIFAYACATELWDVSVDDEMSNLYILSSRVNICCSQININILMAITNWLRFNIVHSFLKTCQQCYTN